MKKWIAGTVGFLLIIIVLIYIFIPSRLAVSSYVTINVTENGCRRFLIDNDSNWLKWWPSTDSSSKTASFTYNQYHYKITGKTINVIDVMVFKNNDSLLTKLIIIPHKFDSIGILWKTTIESGNSPITKWRQYQLAKAIKNNASFILKDLQLFLENEENVYSFNIQRTRVKDTLLIASKFQTTTQPGLTEIYKTIDGLKGHIIKNNAKETGYPMLHTTRLNDTQFETMVAIPMNKEIPGGNNFLIKKMIPGNILITHVKGGNYLIRKAYDALENYLLDYHLTSPAISFESLISDRTTIVDSSQWETKIYYPIY